MKPKDKESKLPKPLTPVEYVKSYSDEVAMLSKELHTISHMPDDLKKLIPTATELLRERLRELHNRECGVLDIKSKTKTA